MESPHLALYFYPSCPFCQWVIRAIDQLNIKVDLRNIHEDDEHLKKLVNDTGRQTVPCLYVTGEPMFESRDIIDWLQKNADHLAKKEGGA